MLTGARPVRMWKSLTNTGMQLQVNPLFIIEKIWLGTTQNASKTDSEKWLDMRGSHAFHLLERWPGSSFSDGINTCPPLFMGPRSNLEPRFHKGLEHTLSANRGKPKREAQVPVDTIRKGMIRQETPKHRKHMTRYRESGAPGSKRLFIKYSSNFLAS